MKKIRILLTTLLFTFVLLAPYSKISAQTTLQNVGFVANPIWYSSDPFYEGDMVKIYTFIFNGNPSTLSASVDFYDGDTILGKKPISINGNTGKDAYISWKVTAGDHKIYAKISNPKILVNGKSESVFIENTTTKTDSRTVPKKIISASQSTLNTQPTNTQDSSNSTYEKVLQQLTNAENAIKNSTPDVIAKPIAVVADGMENFRMLADGLSNDGKISSQNILDKIKNEDSVKVSATNTKSDLKDQSKITTKDDSKNDSIKIQKPWVYMKLYFWSLIHFITSNKVIFYGLIILIIFFIVRTIIRKIRG